jgi:hypothetical protein
MTMNRAAAINTLTDYWFEDPDAILDPDPDVDEPSLVQLTDFAGYIVKHSPSDDTSEVAEAARALIGE